LVTTYQVTDISHLDDVTLRKKLLVLLSPGVSNLSERVGHIIKKWNRNGSYRFYS